MPLPPMTPSGPGLGGAFGALGGLVAPLMMMMLALQRPGPARVLSKAEADCPERARKPATLGVPELHLGPLVRAGVVVREPDGRVWLDRAALRRRQRRRALFLAAPAVVVGIVLALLLLR